MLKKTTAVFLILCFVLSFGNMAFAEDNTVSEKEEITHEKVEGVLNLSLQDAVNMALENNPQIEASEASITSAEFSLKLAKENKKNYDDATKYISSAINVSSGLSMAYMKHGYYLDAANVGLELEKIKKEQVMAKVRYDVTEKYYNVKLMEKLVAIGETSLNLAKENQSVVKKNFELGYVSKLEVSNVDNAVLKAQYSLESYKRNLEIATKSLKLSLLMEGKDCKLNLTDEIKLLEIEGNLQEKIEEAVETRYDCIALRKSYDLAKRYFEITESYMGKSTAAYHSAYSDYINAEYTYENSTKLIKLGLESQHAAIVATKDTVTGCENDLEIKNIEYESAKIKYEMGIITNLELTSVMAELDGAKVQLEKAQLEYLLSVMKFQYDVTIGL